MGIGIATTVDASGFGPSGALSVRPGYETSTVQVDSTGHVTVYTGSSDHGQGHETTFAQIAADELAIPLADISVVYGDTHLIATGTGTRASRSIVVGGSAVVTASRQVRGKAIKLAAALLRTEPQYVQLRQAASSPRIYRTATLPGRTLPLSPADLSRSPRAPSAGWRQVYIGSPTATHSHIPRTSRSLK